MLRLLQGTSVVDHDLLPDRQIIQRPTSPSSEMFGGHCIFLFDMGLTEYRIVKNDQQIERCYSHKKISTCL